MRDQIDLEKAITRQLESYSDRPSYSTIIFEYENEYYALKDIVRIFDDKMNSKYYWINVVILGIAEEAMYIGFECSEKANKYIETKVSYCGPTIENGIIKWEYKIIR